MNEMWLGGWQEGAGGRAGIDDRLTGGLAGLDDRLGVKVLVLELLGI